MSVEVGGDDICGFENGEIWDGDVGEMDLNRGREGERNDEIDAFRPPSEASSCYRNRKNSPMKGKGRA